MPRKLVREKQMMDTSKGLKIASVKADNIAVCPGLTPRCRSQAAPVGRKVQHVPSALSPSELDCDLKRLFPF